MYGLESYSPSLVWLDVFVIDISSHGKATGGLSPEPRSIEINK